MTSAAKRLRTCLKEAREIVGEEFASRLHDAEFVLLVADRLMSASRSAKAKRNADTR